MMDVALEINGLPYRYAQEKAGQQLHIAQVVYNHGFTVALAARCGRQARHWRATFNVPLGHACRNCLRTIRQAG